MMHEFQVTFLVNDVNASVHVAQPLSRVARKFKSTLHIINITRNRSAELTKSLAVLQVGLQEVIYAKSPPSVLMLNSPVS